MWRSLSSPTRSHPVVTLALALRGDHPRGDIFAYVLAQVLGAIAGVWTAHAMFDLPLLQVAAKMRSGPGQWWSEAVATFGLVFVVLSLGRRNARSAPFAVGGYIAAAYWFTASTSFANPAVTLARCLTDTFAGIDPRHAPAFVAREVAGAALACGADRRGIQSPVGAMRNSSTAGFFSSVTASRPAPARSAERMTIV
jgi:glycerol uptake facilitator-like aquaporin